MPWWGWIAAGALLLAGEMAVDSEFYLVFLGTAALAMGLLGLSGAELPVWGQWLLFAGVSLVALVTFRRRLYERLRGSAADLAEGVVGEYVQVEGRVGPGERGHGELRGSRWQIRNAGSQPLEPGARARVASAQGLVLDVRAD